MTSTDLIWLEMEALHEVGGSRRINAEYAHDIFCTIDQHGRRGVLILMDQAPGQLPIFDAMDLTIIRRSDDRAALSIVLLSKTLSHAFTSLCDGLVIACEATLSSLLPDVIVSYLINSNALLEYGDPQVLEPSALRGLIAELIMLQELFKFLSPIDAVSAWVGPLRSAQDFVLADRLIETKAKTAISNKITISSVEQLDPVTPLPLTLAVLTLATLRDDLILAPTPNELVAAIRVQLKQYAASALEFDRRLKAAKYVDRPYYSTVRFRLISMRFYQVGSSFPRLRQADLSKGIISVSYDLDLSECAPFEIQLEDSWI